MDLRHEQARGAAGGTGSQRACLDQQYRARAGQVTGGSSGDPDDSAADHQHIRARLLDDPGPAHELGGLLSSELVTPDSRSCGHDPIMSAAVAAA